MSLHTLTGNPKFLANLELVDMGLTHWLEHGLTKKNCIRISPSRYQDAGWTRLLKLSVVVVIQKTYWIEVWVFFIIVAKSMPFHKWLWPGSFNSSWLWGTLVFLNSYTFFKLNDTTDQFWKHMRLVDIGLTHWLEHGLTKENYIRISPSKYQDAGWTRLLKLSVVVVIQKTYWIEVWMFFIIVATSMPFHK